MSLLTSFTRPAPTRRKKWTAGRWYDLATSHGIASATVNTSLSLDVLRATPFFLPKGERIDRVGFNVNVAASAGKLARVGIFFDGADGTPGALYVDLGTVAIDTTGDKESTVAASPPDDAWYWLAEVHNEAITVPCWTSSVSNVLGRPTVAGTPAASYFKAFTFAALPATFPASPTANATTALYGVRAV